MRSRSKLKDLDTCHALLGVVNDSSVRRDTNEQTNSCPFFRFEGPFAKSGINDLTISTFDCQLDRVLVSIRAFVGLSSKGKESPDRHHPVELGGLPQEGATTGATLVDLDIILPWGCH